MSWTCDFTIRLHNITVHKPLILSKINDDNADPNMHFEMLSEATLHRKTSIHTKTILFSLPDSLYFSFLCLFFLSHSRRKWDVNLRLVVGDGGKSISLILFYFWCQEAKARPKAEHD